MNKIYICFFMLAVFLFANCTTNTNPEEGKPVQEVYSLEWLENEVWQVNHDSDYFNYFNEIQKEYNKRINDTDDPVKKRALFIERDLKIALNRLNYLADRQLVKKVVRSTARVNGANSSGHLFRMQDVDHIPRQSFTPRDPSSYVYKKVNPGFLGTKLTDAISAIIQFDRQLKERGISLIVVPVPNSTQVYAHQLHNEINLENAIWHPWAHMIVKLLEHDVEVLDLLDLYKSYSGDNTTLNYLDHHWGQAGLDIVAQEIAHRLKRFKFDDRFYLEPDKLERRGLTIDTPALIPRWDKISVHSITARMPVNMRYRTVQIRYNGKKVDKAKSHEESPVLIMGDSFIPHVADTASGIYAHLAWHTKIIPAAYSRGAGAAAPPDLYKTFVAGKGKEPNVVIWEIYGSAFNQVNSANNWHVISLPEPKNIQLVSDTHAPTENRSATEQTVVSEKKIQRVEAQVVQVSEIPDPKNLDYPEALYAFKIQISDGGSSGLREGQTIIVYHQFMKDFKIDESSVVKKGATYSFELEGWVEAVKSTAKIDTMQLIDELEDLVSDVYFCHKLK